jgi:C-terminal processing protease CtpA/Prc
MRHKATYLRFEMNCSELESFMNETFEKNNIVNFYQNPPAEDAGLGIGDAIVQIDGEDASHANRAGIR